MKKEVEHKPLGIIESFEEFKDRLPQPPQEREFKPQEKVISKPVSNDLVSSLEEENRKLSELLYNQKTNAHTILKSKEDELNSVKHKIANANKLEQENQELRTNLLNSKKATSKLKELANIKEGELKQQEAQTEELRHELLSIKKSILEKSKSLNNFNLTLKEENQQLQSKLDKKDLAIAEVQKTIEELKRDVSFHKNQALEVAGKLNQKHEQENIKQAETRKQLELKDLELKVKTDKLHNLQKQSNHIMAQMSVKDEQNLILKQKLKELAERHSTLSKTSSGELELLRKDLDVAKSKFSKQSLEKEVTYKMLIDSLKTENEKIKQQLNQQNRVHNTAIDKMVNNLSKLKQTVPESQLHSMVRMALDHGSTHEEVIESLTNVGYKKEKIEEVLNHSSS